MVSHIAIYAQIVLDGHCRNRLAYFRSELKALRTILFIHFFVPRITAEFSNQYISMYFPAGTRLLLVILPREKCDRVNPHCLVNWW
jgi:hypothetical protein